MFITKAFHLAVVDKKPKASDLEEDFERLVPRFLNLQYGSERSGIVAEKIRRFYFKGRALDVATYQAYVDVSRKAAVGEFAMNATILLTLNIFHFQLSTDVHFLESFVITTRSYVKHMRSPIYNYYFLFEGDFNLFKKILNIKNIPGEHLK